MPESFRGNCGLFPAAASLQRHRRGPTGGCLRKVGVGSSGSRPPGISRHLQASRSSFMSLNPADESASKSRSAHSLEESCILSRNLQERRASTQRAVEERAQFAELRTKSST